MQSLSNTFKSDFSNISDIKPGSEIHLYGMVQNIRLTKWGGFLILRKPQGVIQIVLQNNVTTVFDEAGNPSTLSALCREMSIEIKGISQSANIKDLAAARNDVEVAASVITIVSRPSTSDVADLNAIKFGTEEQVLKYKFDNRQVTLRNSKDIAIFRVSAAISKAFTDFLTAQGFTQIYSPKIVSEGAEGGANVFSLDYFGKPVYLAQSPQFYKQIGVGVFERVFEIAPAYRAEKHNTSRHLNEYISLDVEMGFIKGQEDVMMLELSLLRSILSHLSENYSHELSLFDANLPLLPEEVPVFKLSEAHEVLWENGLTQDHRGEPDMAPEEEKAICAYVKEKYNSDFVFITHFPSAHRAFYAMNDPTDPSLTLSFDLLMRGLEITSGGQRIHLEKDYRNKMIDRGMNPDNFTFYLDTFHNGMPPHGGFAIGLERITSCILGINNVKEASLFPRDINRVTP